MRGGGADAPPRTCASVGSEVPARVGARRVDAAVEAVEALLQRRFFPPGELAVVGPHAGFLAADRVQRVEVATGLVAADRAVPCRRADTLFEPGFSGVEVARRVDAVE